MKKILTAPAATFAALIIAATVPAGQALAQYTGPSSVPVLTVQQLQEQGKDDQVVILRGRITSHDGDEHYTFTDDTGSIRVEIDDRRLPKGQAFDDKTQVELVGEYDKNFRSAEVEVDEVRILR